jgi:ABC-type multidrug transport system fused ATPase/permease subunit
MMLMGAGTLIIWSIALGKARLYAVGLAGGALSHRVYARLFDLPFTFYEGLSDRERARYGQARLSIPRLWDKALVPMLIAVMWFIIAWDWGGASLLPLLMVWAGGTPLILLLIWRTPPYPDHAHQTVTADIIAHMGELRNLDALAWMMRRWWDARPRWVAVDWVAHRFLALAMMLVLCLCAVLMRDMSVMRLAGLLLAYGALMRGLDALAEGVRVIIKISPIPNPSPIEWGKGANIAGGARVPPLHAMGRGLGGGDTAPTIHIRALTFAYPTAPAPALHDITLTIGAGRLIGVVGKTGSGKSALLAALMGVYPAQHGDIWYDDLPLREYGAVLRRQVGAVTGWSRVHRGSVLMNIGGHTRGTIERAWQVAELVGLADFIARLPMEMHTIIDDDGAVFSEGQRGRLLLARALFYHPKMLLLDEALASVDESLEVQIHSNIAPLGMTRVIITHRRKTLMLADDIIVLDGGRVVQHGTYDDLLARDGIFGDMMRTQIT